MSIDYKQLRILVHEAMFTGGGINEPSAPEGVPHRMPAADTDTPEQDKGDPDANKMYDVALKAREATEALVEALDEPVYDDAYEFAFKASACLRKALNSLIQSGAHPMPTQRVVAPPADQQPYGGGGGGGMNYYSMGYAGMGGEGSGLQEADNAIPDEATLRDLGVKNPPEVRAALEALHGLDPGDLQRVLQSAHMIKEHDAKVANKG